MEVKSALAGICILLVSRMSRRGEGALDGLDFTIVI
jgi:hypothetical protein